jgi:hypothetical protein
MDLNSALFEKFQDSIDSTPGGNTIELSQQLLRLVGSSIDSLIDNYFAEHLIVRNYAEIEQDLPFLAAFQLNSEYLRLNFIDDWLMEEALSSKTFSAERYKYLFPQQQGSPALYNTYLYAALEQKVVRAVCPHSGQVLDTSISFPIFIDKKWAHIVFYKFYGQEPFYMGTGGYPGIRSFVYLPKRKLVVVSPLFFQLGYTTEHLYGAVAALYKKFIAFTEKTVKYLGNDKKSLTLLYGLQTNLGHFFTNEYTGLFRIVITGLYRRVQHILVYKNCKIKLDQLFEEFNNIPRSYCNSEDQLFEMSVSYDLFVLYPCASHISAEAAFHIQNIANRYSNSEQQQCIAQCVADPLIFINLRKHNKAWQEQISGVVCLAEALQSHYPRLGIFLDGMADCQNDVNEITEKLANKVTAYNGANVSLMDTICWACRSDAYLCVIGSGLVLLTCIANKPGVVHSEHGHMGQVRPGGYWSGLRNDIFPPVLVPPNEITVIQDNENKNMPGYENYSMDWHSLYKRLLLLLYKPLVQEK